MDNFFSSPELFNNLAKKQIYCCRTVKLNTEALPQDLALKTIKMKQGDIHVRTRTHLIAILWRDKRDIYMLPNIQEVPAKGNFGNVGRKVIKPQIVTDYNHHMGYVDKGDRTANSYSISRHTFK
jgi:hypothetical protein